MSELYCNMLAATRAVVYLLSIEKKTNQDLRPVIRTWMIWLLSSHSTGSEQKVHLQPPRAPQARERRALSKLQMVLLRV